MQNLSGLSHSASIAPVSIAHLQTGSSSKSKMAKSKDDGENKPKRPLSSYNIFFKYQRQKILEITPTRECGKPRRSHGKIGFAELARTIADRWNDIHPGDRRHFDLLAAQDKARYQGEMKVYKATRDAEEAAEMFKSVPLNVADAKASAGYYNLGQIRVEDSSHTSMTVDSLESLLAKRNKKAKTSHISKNYGYSSVPSYFMSADPCHDIHPLRSIGVDMLMNRHSTEEPLPLDPLESMASEAANELDDESLDLVMNVFL